MEIPGESREGDYICYIWNLVKFTSHYPNWEIIIGVDEILGQLITDHTQLYCPV